MTLPKLQNTKDEKNPFGTVLAYGPAGAGKTRSIVTLIEEGLNPLVIVTELGRTGGLLSVLSREIPFVKISSHEETIEVIQELKKKPGKIEYQQTEFGSVVLDSITQWGEYPLQNYAKMKGWVDLQTPQDRKDPRQAYGYLAEKGRQLYGKFFELHGHIYVIAREGLFGGEGDVPLFGAPELPGQKLPREVPGWPDATVRLRVYSGKHMMYTQAEGNSPARIRTPENFPKLPLRCNPNIGALMKFMCGDKSQYDKLVPEDPKKAATTAAAPPTPAPAVKP